MCRHVEDERLCPKFGEGIFLNIKGEPYCDCWDGWVRENKSDSCVQMFTKGFCSDSEVIAIADGQAVCVDNPCGNSMESLPHL